MSVSFKSRRSSIPDANGNHLYYPQLITGPAMDTRQIAAKINEVSAMSQGDVISVLTNLADVMRRAFEMGRSVHIDGVGSFYLTAKSQGHGVSCAEDVGAGQIKGVKVCFREESRRCGGKSCGMLTDGVRFVKREVNEALKFHE